MSSTPQTDPQPIRPVFGPDVLGQLAEGAPVREVPARTILFRRGDVADAMYIVEEGIVEIHLDDAGAVTTLGPGELLGELAILTDADTRSATAVTATACRLRVVASERVDALLDANPDAMGRALRHACAYLLGAQFKLAGDLRRRNEELERAFDYMRRTKEELDAAEVRAHTDELTGLYNRRCMNQQLPRFLDRAGAGGHADQGVAVLAMDLDKFKPINDDHGHPAGDLVLKSVAAILRSTMRASDLPCRVGGDEFSVVLWPTHPEDASAIAARVQAAVSSAVINAPEGVLRVGITVGGTMFRKGDNPEALIARADEYLYVAKEAGRNVVVWEGCVLGPR